MTAKANEIGKSYYNCTVINYIKKVHKSHWVCLFKCGHCGSEFEALLNNVKKGNTKSCGCQRNKNHFKTHGYSSHRIYNLWRGMISRCTLTSHIIYKNYGGRGIKVCERWLKFENFIDDMGIPDYKVDIERLNNDGNYEPSNCKWVTRWENSQNKRTTKKFIIDGKSLTISQMAKLYNINRKCLAKRIRSGWSIKDAVSIPSRANKSIDKSAKTVQNNIVNQTGLMAITKE